MLVGDRDGVLVIPRHLAAEIAEQGLEQEQLEAFASTKIHAGEPLWGNYPPGEETMAEYKASSRRPATGPPGGVGADGREECGMRSRLTGTGSSWSAAGSAG